MVPPVPLPAVVLLVHVGHRKVALPAYLSRVLVVLLAFAVVAVGTYWGLEAARVIGSGTRTRADAEEADR